MTIKIGQHAKEVHCGVRGKVTARCEYIDGHVEFQIQPPVDKEGKFVGGLWAPEGNLAKVEAPKEDTADENGEDEKPAKETKKVVDEDDADDADDTEDEDETELEASDDEDSDEDSDEDDAEDEDGDEKPAKKAKKLTIDDVNDACKKYAAKSSVADTIALLKKHFKAKSISKLKPEQYAQAIKVLSKK